MIFLFSFQKNTFAQTQKRYQPARIQKKIPVKKEVQPPSPRNAGINFLWTIYESITIDQKLFEKAVINLKIPSHIHIADVRVHLTNRARHKVKKEVIKNLSNKKALGKLVTLALMYMPIIDKIFKTEKIPFDLKYVMLLESRCVGNAKSNSKDPAIGYWQFKSKAAKWVGLKMNNTVDERMNIVASTHGFIKYINNVNKKFDNYIFSVMAFYLGLKGCEDMLNRLNIKNKKIVKVDHQWHFYIYLFLAYQLVFSKILPLFRSHVRLAGGKNCNGLTVAQVCKKYSIKPEVFYIFNRWLKINKIPHDNKNIIIIPLKV